MFKLLNKTKEIASISTGLSVNDIDSLCLVELEQKLASKIGKPLEYLHISDDRLLGRGNIYMYFNRLIGKSEVDVKLSRI